MPKLYPEDQKRVDEFIQSNINELERNSFKPMLLLSIIFVVLGGLTLISFFVAKSHGVL